MGEHMSEVVPGKHDPLSTIPASRHPFQFLVMFALALSGLNVITGDPPPSVSHLFYTTSTVTWGVLMMGTGLMALIAAFWRDRIMGLLIERIALFGMGGACLVYVGALVVVYGTSNGLVSILIFLSISAACFWRIAHVNRELVVLQRFMLFKKSQEGLEE